MAKYIDVESLVVAYSGHTPDDDFSKGVDFVLGLLDSKPPADVRPVRRGKWELDNDNIPHCTECGCVAPQRLFLQVKSLACTTQFIMSDYCPDCGSYNGGDAEWESTSSTNPE